MSKSAIDRTCDKHGCAKIALDPKLHVFDDCFGGYIRMGDVDGAVERNGYILWLEWKCGGDINSFEKTHQAQVIQAKAFTKNSDKQKFIFVIGDPIAMRVDYVRIVERGAWKSGWQAADLGRLKRYLRNWYAVADGASAQVSKITDYSKITADEDDIVLP